MEEQETNPGYSESSFLARLFWCGFGPLLWLGVLWPISLSLVGLWELAFVLVVIFMMTCRYLEWKGGGAMTLHGEVTTINHVRRYCIQLGVVSLAAWLATKFLSRV